MCKTNKIRSLNGRKAYVVEIEEISRRSIIIYDNAKADFESWDAVETAESLCNEGTVNLDFDDFQSRNCTVLREATQNDINLLDAFPAEK